MKVAAFFLISLFASVAASQTVTDNAKLTELFNVDQAARHGKNIDWPKLSAEDEVRRQEVHRMLEAGEVKTGNDYFHAALIYQHGMKPDDYLLAHVLAVDALSLGDKRARWLSAATLDRYLLAVSQPQIYGTQFTDIPGKSDSWAQRTINSSLLTDSMRNIVCVVPLEEQEKILDAVKHGGALRSTGIKNCK